MENKVKHKDVASDLLRNLYVDDTVNSVDDDRQAENFWTTAVNIFHQGGFNLRKFQSNSQNLKIEKKEETTRKVLGVLWHINRYEFIPLADVRPIPKRSTKREVASLMAGIYDPLGLIAPVVTPLKCFLQDLWKLKVSWDVTLDVELQSHLQKILSNLEGCKTVAVPRWLGNIKQATVEQDVSLHVFTDASCRAYAAAVYVRVKCQSTTSVSLVTAKCRLAPPKGENSTAGTASNVTWVSAA